MNQVLLHDAFDEAPPRGSLLYWLQNPPHGVDRALLDLLCAMADADGVDASRFVCDPRAIDAVARVIPKTQAILYRLMTAKLFPGLPVEPVELAIYPEQGEIIFAVWRGEGTDESPLQICDERVPIPSFTTQATLRGLNWLDQRLRPLERFLWIRFKIDIFSDGRTDELSASPLDQDAPSKCLFADEASSGIRLLALGEVSSLQRCFSRDAVVQKFSAPADVVIFTDATLHLREAMWRRVTTAHPILGQAGQIIIADRVHEAEAGAARLVRWDCPLREFRDIVISLSRQSGPKLDRETNTLFAHLVEKIENRVETRASVRREIFCSYARSRELTIDEAESELVAAEARAHELLPQHLRPIVNQLRSLEFDEATIAEMLPQYRPDVKRWLRARNLPTVKELATRAQVDRARRLIAGPPLTWKELADEIGLSESFVKKWLAANKVIEPKSYSRNVRIAKILRRQRSKLS